ncbi:hypothetical protein [Nocardioides alkalitolerans]|uniref:phage terminase small subunit n=1 Tax=Nocardioides alkalitolerans TaxID=281714 RepID=UPI00048C41DA|nr:hypothetical protein [Nocardioides alkalitolerans]
MPGPIPQREDALARPRARKGSDQQAVTKGELRPVAVPEPDEDWHPIARMVWDGMVSSGQADFFQNSDWAFAWSTCEELSLYKSPKINRETGEEYHKRSPEMLKALLASLTSLLVTEGDRRRVRIELTSPEPDENAATVAQMDNYRNRLKVVES